ncbi:MAG: ATP-binding cassette domain-containing protein [Bdellovibrionaceae bacterium]|nr:ATP-binding cassette domain-containing protein [Pseudobdellovibrionaceae bacterium]
MKFIEILGAKENNLQNINVKIPKNKFTVITGLSGSGKSSLAFDVLFTEGQRRYIESLSPSSSYFTPSFKQANVDQIIGISPSISVAQARSGINPRSTVGTVTEIYDYLRLLYARIGEAYCPTHKIPTEGLSSEEIYKKIFIYKKTKLKNIIVLAPVIRGQKGSFQNDFQKWMGLGITKALIDGQLMDLHPTLKLARYKEHNIDLILDRLPCEERYYLRFLEAVQKSFEMTNGFVKIQEMEKPLSKKSILFSENHSCPKCNFSFPEIEMQLFSFNHIKGACDTCSGLGVVESDDDEVKICSCCKGNRLNKKALNVFIQEMHISYMANLSLLELESVLKKLQLPTVKKEIAFEIIKNILSRLNYIKLTNTEYLSLNRSMTTLSGGEAQRVRLTTQLGSSLTGLTYILDEPSIGLHPYHQDQLLNVIKQLCKKGNTLIVVEHDLESIRQSNYLIDLGLGSGINGGNIIFEGNFKDLKKNKHSITSQYIFHKKQIAVQKPRKPKKDFLSLTKANKNNITNLDIKIPLGLLCGITGASGSGKSTLILDILYKNLKNKILYPRKNLKLHNLEKISGFEELSQVLQIDQKPIGKTSRSVPATYVKLFVLIRKLFAKLPESQIRGLKESSFSFNSGDGRCTSCEGLAYIKVEINSLPTSMVLCETCQGRRYSPHILAVKYNNKSIADVLEMSVEEAVIFFKNHKLIYKKLNMLKKVGLSYLKLGQASQTLSGGEAQRIKLSRELSKASSRKILYILDEPTTGLHIDDVSRLINLLKELVDNGHSVVVIEHNMELIKCCDYVIDCGPYGGVNGGKIIAKGTPEQIAQSKKSLTAPYLKKALFL